MRRFLMSAAWRIAYAAAVILVFQAWIANLNAQLHKPMPMPTAVIAPTAR